MSSKGARKSSASAQVLAENPLEGEQLLLDAMFGGRRKGPGRPAGDLKTESQTRAREKPKPQHYKIVSISMYVEDIQRLEGMVRELKRRGHYKANKSQLIRYALSQLDLDTVPKEM